MNKKTIIYSIKSALPVMTGYIVLSIGFRLWMGLGNFNEYRYICWFYAVCDN